jgi:hypothetical protein
MTELNGRHFEPLEWNDLLDGMGWPWILVENIIRRAMKIPYAWIQDILETAELR